jgi:hypothetical protein
VNAAAFQAGPNLISNNMAYVTGNAPVNVEAILINGISADLDILDGLDRCFAAGHRHK